MDKVSKNVFRSMIDELIDPERIPLHRRIRWVSACQEHSTSVSVEIYDKEDGVLGKGDDRPKQYCFFVYHNDRILLTHYVSFDGYHLGIFPEAPTGSKSSSYDWMISPDDAEDRAVLQELLKQLADKYLEVSVLLSKKGRS